MAKHSDVRRAAVKSELCQYRRYEPAKARHARRYDTAHSEPSLRLIRGFCNQRGLSFDTFNEGEHFIIRDDSPKALAQWWPRTAKLVIRCDWRRGVHCHDAKQLLAEVAGELNRG